MRGAASVPKALLEVGGMPILCHIMELYGRYGFCDFILPLGYKGHKIKEYFSAFPINRSDYRLSLEDGHIVYFNTAKRPWNITFVDTGLDTQTGARLAMLQKYITEDHFFATYADGLSDVDIGKLLAYHHRLKRIATGAVASICKRAVHQIGRASCRKECRSRWSPYH